MSRAAHMHVEVRDKEIIPINETKKQCLFIIGLDTDDYLSVHLYHVHKITNKAT